MKTKLCLMLALGAIGLAPWTQVLAQTDTVSKEDKEFFKNAGEINMTETALGRLAQEKAFSPEVKALGATLVADHTAMTADLAALAKQKRVEMDIEATARQKTMLAAFDNKTGVDFDREFREHVAKDHAKAIKMFTDAEKDSKDPDVKAFAAKNLASLQAHLQMVGGKQ